MCMNHWVGMVHFLVEQRILRFSTPPLLQVPTQQQQLTLPPLDAAAEWPPAEGSKVPNCRVSCQSEKWITLN